MLCQFRGNGPDVVDGKEVSPADVARLGRYPDHWLFQHQTQKVPDEPPEVLYQKARIKLDTGNYLNAIELLEALDSRYPFGAYSTRFSSISSMPTTSGMIPPRRSPTSTVSSALNPAHRTSITSSICAA